MPIITRNQIQNYAEKHIEKSDNPNEKQIYNSLVSWLNKNPGRISGIKFGEYLNKEIDWTIDFTRCEKRTRGRITRSTRRIGHSVRSTLYQILKDFRLARIRTLE